MKQLLPFCLHIYSRCQSFSWRLTNSWRIFCKSNKIYIYCKQDKVNCKCDNFKKNRNWWDFNLVILWITKFNSMPKFLLIQYFSLHISRSWMIWFWWARPSIMLQLLLITEDLDCTSRVSVGYRIVATVINHIIVQINCNMTYAHTYCDSS